MPVTRRAWLAGSTAWAAALHVGGDAWGQSGGSSMKIIDAHTHFYPAEWVSLVEKEGAAHGARIGRDQNGNATFALGGLASTFSRVYSDLDSRIKYMDGVNVDMHVLSLMAPMVYWAPASFGLKLSQVYNDSCSAAHQKHPSRFIGMAMLPMQDPVLALQELERAGKLPGLRGAMMGTEINGKNLDEKSFFPVYAKCEELGWPIFVHPINPLGRERMERHYLQNLLGNPIEVGLAGYSLILGGALDAFPRLEVMLPRAGGNVPWGIGRLQRTVERWPQVAKAEKPASDYLRRFYYDSIIESADLLMSLIQLVGADRILFGTDYASVMRDARPREFIEELSALPQSDRNLVLGGNAARVFKVAA
jgi:aminocarboxymuconate-semialdehyde decarboxylase